ncbi:MAG: hypothetical protein OXH16_02590 [Gemmatimonadetes bacterium]|nr:hypothetical protein [Gemmatimonadota bacterium]
MTSSITREFRRRLYRLSSQAQRQAAQAYQLWRSNPYHSSLQFKRVSPRQPIFAVRIGMGYRALGLRDRDHIFWFWIGSHAAYNQLLKRL